MESTNIFNYATSELSQDAFICWLLSFALKENHGKDSALEACALDVLHQIPKLQTIESIAKIDRQVSVAYGRIDILLTIGDYLVIIEDKTFTNAACDQLLRYRKGLVEKRKISDENVICVFYKIIEQAQAEKDVDFEFTREKLLQLLRPYKDKINSDVFHYYVDYLEHIDNIAHLYKTQAIGEWEALTYWGFFRHLKEQGLVSKNCGWGYVANPSGGFLGLWWDFYPGNEQSDDFSKGCFDSVYLQIENDKIAVKLCADPIDDYDTDNVRAARQQIFDYFASHIDDFTKRWRLGNYMTVGYIEYNESNYREQITKMQQIFNEMKADLKISV